MADKPQTVTVEALKYHTYNGKAYQVGDTYEFAEDYADGLAAGGFAVRVDRVAHAKQQAKVSAKPSTAVKPMTLKPGAAVRPAKTSKKK